MDALQQVIRSPQLPQRIRGFCTHQSTDQNNQRELLELLRLWMPLLFTRVGPSLGLSWWPCRAMCLTKHERPDQT